MNDFINKINGVWLVRKRCMSCDCDYGGGDGDVSSWRNFSSCWNI